MSAQEKAQETQKKLDLQREKDAFREREKERLSQNEKARFTQQQQHLREQMVIRQDYYNLNWWQYALMAFLALSLISSVGLLLLTYHPLTKNLVFSLMNFL